MPMVLGAWPRLLDSEKAALYLGISKRFLLDCVANHTLPAPKRIGARVLWDKHVLDQFVDVMFGNDQPEAKGSNFFGD